MSCRREVSEKMLRDVGDETSPSSLTRVLLLLNSSHVGRLPRILNTNTLPSREKPLRAPDSFLTTTQPEVSSAVIADKQRTRPRPTPDNDQQPFYCEHSPLHFFHTMQFPQKLLGTIFRSVSRTIYTPSFSRWLSSHF